MGFVPVNTTMSSTGFRFSRSASGGSRASNSEDIMSPNEEEGSLEGNRSGEMDIQEISGPILPPQSPKVSPQGGDSQQSSADESLEPPSASITIQLPEATNAEDYKLLPGHGIIRRVLRSEPDDSESTTYSILHRSGEVQVLSIDRLLELENGAQALDAFLDPESTSDEIEMSSTRRRRPPPYLSGDASFDIPSESDYDGSGARRNPRRRPAASHGYTKFFEVPESSSNEDNSSSDELQFTGHSNRGRAKPRLRRKRQVVVSSDDEASSSSSAENHRRSSRQRGRPRKSLRERHEDDLSEVESEGPKRPKYTGAKEIFQEIAWDDDFTQRHLLLCNTCGLYGDDKVRGRLIPCQGCSFAYHQACLGPRATRDHLVTKIGEEDFILQCRFCLGMSHEKYDISPHTGKCSVCKELGPMSKPLRERLSSKEEQQLRIANGYVDPATPIDAHRVNSADNVLFRCPTCQRGFHADHLPPVEGVEVADIYEHYSTHWRCHECNDVPGTVEKLVAWRPVDPNLKIGNGTGAAQLIPGDQKEYLIKWKDMSYFRVTWMPGDWVWGVTKVAMRRAFYKTPTANKPIFTIKEAVPEDHLRVDIVFDVTYFRDNLTSEEKEDIEMVKEAFVKYQGLNYEDSVREMPPSEADTERWNDFKVAFEDFVRRDSISPPDRPALNKHLSQARRLDFEEELELHEQSALVTKGELMEYQLEGVNWLYYKFLNRQNAILADDMGLGKTIQIIGLLATLIERHGCWPFLIVAPNATVPNWRREVKTWAPAIRVVTYFGSSYARKLAKDYEMFPDNLKNLRAHVVIASYESMVDDETSRLLGKINWGGLVVDEGQRLKNDESQLYTKLRRLRVDFKVLLTGTPLQNNIRELFNLIQFLDSGWDAAQLEEKYGQQGDLTTDEIRTLHEMIRPFFLRRTKAQVLPFLPPMAQIIVPISMSIVQKKLYKTILEKNPQLLKAIMTSETRGMPKKERGNLNNILMQLRKCLCHPFVFNREIEEAQRDPEVALQRLIEASGKFELLNLMIPKLKERGHRILIFSQFLDNLDIVEDFLSGIGVMYRRLDGQLEARKKQQQIDDFNAPDSPYTAFLLSTRSGGVGINLATADTVIIMDPDFNPKQDMQALSRAHRIGQKNTVLVFQLTTKGTVEEKIMQKGKRKLALDHVLIERMEDDEDEDDLESVLRHGAQALFNDDGDSADTRYDAESIDKLLDRSQIEKDAAATTSNETGQDQPQFAFARVWQKDRGTLEEVTETEEAPADSKFWEEVLQKRELVAMEEQNRKAEGLGRGKRKRNKAVYIQKEDAMDIDDDSSAKATPVKPRKGKGSESDVEFEATKDHASSSSSEGDFATADSGDQELRSPEKKKRRPFRRAAVVPPLSNLALGTDGAMDARRTACVACERVHEPGFCPLKLAGTESCPLCGIAHYGGNRICPHLHSKVQLLRMREALNRSNESPELIAAARKYVSGVFHSIAASKRAKAAQEQPPSAAPRFGKFALPDSGSNKPPAAGSHYSKNAPSHRVYPHSGPSRAEDASVDPARPSNGEQSTQHHLQQQHGSAGEPGEGSASLIDLT